MTPCPLPGVFPGGNWTRCDRLAVEVSLEVVGQLSCAGITLRRVFAEAFQADDLEIPADPRLQPARRDRLLGPHEHQRADRRRTLQRHSACEHLVEDHSERVDIGRRPDVLVVAARLLRGHVAGRADDVAVLCLAGVDLETLGDAEIRDLGHAYQFVAESPSHVQQDIDRLQIAMHDAVRVGVMNGTRDGGQQTGRFAWGLGFARQSGRERPSLDQFQRQEKIVVVFDDLVNLHDIGVSELGQRLRLDLRSAQRPRVNLVEALQGHQPTEPFLSGLVDHPIPP